MPLHLSDKLRETMLEEKGLQLCSQKEMSKAEKKNNTGSFVMQSRGFCT
jgi:hypothetical protein